MRRYDEPVEVHRGLVAGVEAPEQFRWRGRSWTVRAVLARWAETGAWWQSAGMRAAVSADNPDSPDPQETSVAVPDLLAERELWRVQAGRSDPRLDPRADPGTDGVFDLARDWSDGCWRLVACVD